MRLAKTFKSSTFRLALIAIGAFGLIVSAIFAYVYWSTLSYVRDRSDRAIMTEQASLADAYSRSGRDGLTALIAQRVADKGFADHVDLLVGPGSAGLAGNLRQWPAALICAMKPSRSLISRPTSSRSPFDSVSVAPRSREVPEESCGREARNSAHPFSAAPAGHCLRFPASTVDPGPTNKYT